MGFVSKLCLLWNYRYLVTYPKAYRFNYVPSRSAFIHSFSFIFSEHCWELGKLFFLYSGSEVFENWINLNKQITHSYLWFNSCCRVSWTPDHFLGLPFPEFGCPFCLFLHMQLASVPGYYYIVPPWTHQPLLEGICGSSKFQLGLKVLSHKMTICILLFMRMSKEPLLSLGSHSQNCSGGKC